MRAYIRFAVISTLAGLNWAARNERIFAYMDTRNEAGTQKRKHVFALSTEGSLAQRVTSKINEWREQDDEHYSCTLNFASPEVRNQSVNRLYGSVTQFNRLAREYFARENKTVPADHLFTMTENFGPSFEQDNLYLPTRNELNLLHQQVSSFLNNGSCGVLGLEDQRVSQCVLFLDTSLLHFEGQESRSPSRSYGAIGPHICTTK